MTYDELKATVEQVQAEFQTPLSLYYIGNCGPGFDDRSWAIRFTEYRDNERPRHHHAYHNLVMGNRWREMSVVQLVLALRDKLTWLQTEALASSPLVTQLDLQDAMDDAERASQLFRDLGPASDYAV
jgi:hypothetical protein